MWPVRRTDKCPGGASLVVRDANQLTRYRWCLWIGGLRHLKIEISPEVSLILCGCGRVPCRTPDVPKLASDRKQLASPDVGRRFELRNCPQVIAINRGRSVTRSRYDLWRRAVCTRYRRLLFEKFGHVAGYRILRFSHKRVCTSNN